jgi:hypothetical protein
VLSSGSPFGLEHVEDAGVTRLWRQFVAAGHAAMRREQAAFLVCRIL